jgi:hypothetical protein
MLLPLSSVGVRLIAGSFRPEKESHGRQTAFRVNSIPLVSPRRASKSCSVGTGGFRWSAHGAIP